MALCLGIYVHLFIYSFHRFLCLFNLLTLGDLLHASILVDDKKKKNPYHYYHKTCSGKKTQITY